MSIVLSKDRDRLWTGGQVAYRDMVEHGHWAILAVMTPSGFVGRCVLSSAAKWLLLIGTGRRKILGLRWNRVDLVRGSLVANEVRVMTRAGVIDTTPKS